MPKFSGPGATAFKKLQDAVAAVNQAAAAGGDVDEAFMTLMDKAATACDKFRETEVDVSDVTLTKTEKKTYKDGTLTSRGRLTIEFDYYEGGTKKHYSGV